MKELVVILLLSLTSVAQTTLTRSRIFKSPDGAFQFRYPNSLILCQAQYEEPMPDTDTSDEVLDPRLVGWTPDACAAQMHICPTNEENTTDNGPLHPEAITCFAYPNSAYEGTSFSGGAFSVSEVSDATTKSDCLQFDRIMSAVCLIAISLPYAKLSFVPRWVFWWSYSPGAFFLWIAVSVGLAVFAGIKGWKL
jgi:hypothetical protein